jgi:hypothetical protein
MQPGSTNKEIDSKTGKKRDNKQKPWGYFNRQKKDEHNINIWVYKTAELYIIK